MKQQLKRLLPRWLLRALLPLYHLTRAVLANLIFFFPAKKMKVIAITGTNGKTTTAAYITTILEEAGYRTGVSTTAFYKIAGKVTINDTNMTVVNPFKLQWQLRKMRWKKVDWVVLEVTSHALAQNRVWGIPIVAAVMTNLTQDHLDYHKSMDDYAASKGKLFAKKPEVIVLNRDDAWFEYFDAYHAEREKVTYGTAAESDARIIEAKLGPDGSTYKMNFDETNIWDFKTHLPGKFNVYNAAAAASVTYALRIDKESIIKGVEALPNVPGRMQSVDAGQHFSVVIDYAHTPDALSNVLETLKHLTPNRLILVFGATGDRDKKKRPIMGQVAAKLADRIYLTDEEPYSEDPASIRSDVMKGIEKGKGLSKTEDVADRREAMKKALRIARHGDTVVITGMGHQEYMTIASGKIPWNDARVVEELIKELGKTSSPPKPSPRSEVASNEKAKKTKKNNSAKKKRKKASKKSGTKASKSSKK